jgi:hypothetical protein
VVDQVRSKTGVEEVDHDKILLMGLKKHPKMFPSYLKLSPYYQQKLIEGLEAQFNMAQLIQGENIPKALEGVKVLKKDALDLFVLHAVYDMAGAAGHVAHNGSIVLTESTYSATVMCVEALLQFLQGSISKRLE